MVNFIVGLILGAIGSLLIVGNNPKLGRYFYKISNKIEEIVEKKIKKV